MNMLDKSPRILIYDIETSLQPVAVFGLAHNDWINPDNILAERHLVSMCWKWLGEKKVYSVSLLDDPTRFDKDPHDDYHVVKVAHQVLQEADCLVAHHGDSFDKKYLETRMLVHDFSPLPPITSIDTKKVASSRFYFNSNSLNYIGQFLSVGKKIDTEKGLWLDVMKGDRKAIRKMVEYNRGDVELLEKVYLKLQPYIQTHINRQLFGGVGCPRCGSKKVQSRGLHRAISRVYRRWQCQRCGGWFRSVVNEKDVKTTARVL